MFITNRRIVLLSVFATAIIVCPIGALASESDSEQVTDCCAPHNNSCEKTPWTGECLVPREGAYVRAGTSDLRIFNSHQKRKKQQKFKTAQ
jgi:hypothetical protein